MKISDDISKPKKEDKDQPLPESKLENENIQNSTPEEGVTEIPIDRSGINKPVYEDIFDDHEEPFKHIKDAVDTIKLPPEATQKTTNKPKDGAVKPKRKSKKNLIFIIILILIGFLYILFFKSNFKKIFSTDDSGASMISEEDSGVQIISGQDYTQADNNTNNETDTQNNNTEIVSQPQAPENTSPQTSQADNIDKSIIKIKVLNGNGITGSAAILQKVLTDNGFTIDSVSNASRFTYATTIIYYNTGKLAEAELAKATLTNYSVTTTENAQVAGIYDLVIVVGKQ